MATKFEEPYEETIDLFKKKIAESGIHPDVKITIVSNAKMKEVFKVTKGSEILKFRAGDDVVIFINETVFDMLTDEQREIVVDEALAGIHYDIEKEKLIITKPDLIAYSGIVSKYGFDKYSVLQETIRLIYAQQGDKEEVEG